MDVDEIINKNKLLEDELQKTKEELIKTKEHLKKYINKLERPSYLCRTSNQAVLPNCYKQTIQGNEKPNLKQTKVKRVNIVPF